MAFLGTASRPFYGNDGKESVCVSRAFDSTEVRVCYCRNGRITPFRKRRIEMAQCEVCGNEYDKEFWMRRNMAWNALWRRNYRTSGSALLLTI